jgi:hypothetical protein
VKEERKEDEGRNVKGEARKGGEERKVKEGR